MNPSTLEWVEKAEADFYSAQREYRARKRPNFDAACFFAQQCVEKYLKARLTEAGVAFPRTHDLETLLDLVAPLQPQWEIMRGSLAGLSSFAANFRYPGESATRDMARIAVNDATDMRQRFRCDMGLAP